LSDLCLGGLRGDRIGGVIGGDGSRSIFFDMDGTRAAVRQRAVPGGQEYPAAVSRLGAATAPGYTGRRRGERVRNRMTIQQRHSSEWLGTFGEAGNGDASAMLAAGCRAVVSYLTARELPLSCAVVRTDGEHGWLHRPEEIRSHGLGFLTRFCDYRALRDVTVRGALAAGAIARTRHLDSNTERELFDLPDFVWTTNRVGSMRIRLVITRRRAALGERPSVGKRIGEWVYEMFATDRGPAVWDAAQVCALYHERGAFERVLGEEDREAPTDRWVSYAADGQEFWQILCQWVWNLRVRAAIAARDEKLARERMDTIAEPFRGEAVILSEAQVATAESRDDGDGAKSDDAKSDDAKSDDAKSDDAKSDDAKGDGAKSDDTKGDRSGTKGPSSSPPLTGFRYRDEHTVVCPAGVLMRPIERTPTARGTRIRFAAPAAQCNKCPQSQACRGTPHSERPRGRRVVMPLWSEVGTAPAPSTPRPAPGYLGPSRLRAPAGTTVTSWETTWKPTALWLENHDAGQARRWLTNLLRGQQIQIRSGSTPPPPPPELLRSRRAHRRSTWVERWGRNLLTRATYSVTLAGIPEALAIRLQGRAPPG
jgi:hypothetical protein